MVLKTWTRKTLADDVRKAFGFDLGPLWIQLQATGKLPARLPENWDPLGDPQGVFPHLKDHCAWRMTAGKKTDRPPCKACGVAKVVLGCLLAMGGSGHPHSLSFAGDLAKATGEIGRIRRRLLVAGRRYEGVHKIEFQGFVERQRTTLMNASQEQADRSEEDRRRRKEVLEQNLARLAELHANPETAGVWALNKLARVNKVLNMAVREMRAVTDDVLVDLRGVLDVDAWTVFPGNQTKMVTLVEKTLREEGYSWREIADLVEGDVSREAVDRVRARVEGRGGKAKKKAK